jgi:hypothetical protein
MVTFSFSFASLTVSSVAVSNVFFSNGTNRIILIHFLCIHTVPVFALI